MVAHPGDPDRGIPSDPTNGAFVDELGEVAIDIAYGGSCTAGKIDDLDFYHQVVREAVAAGLRVADGRRLPDPVRLAEVERYCREHGFIETFASAGVRLIQPGCGACIGCGPGVSEQPGAGHRLGHQPQLQGPLGPGPALPGLAADGRRLGLHRQDHRLPPGHVRAASGGGLAARPGDPS